MPFAIHRSPRPAGVPQAVVAAIALLGLSYSLASHATDVATKPLRGSLLVEPNVVFIYDDSGSMDAEILLDTNEGAVWWNADIASAWSSSTGKPQDQNSGNVYQFRKLFPQWSNTMSTGTEGNVNLYRALPPITQLAWTRSSSFNRLYYNPAVTYEPWRPAIEPHNVASGTVTNYANASPSAALTHPSLSLHPTPPNRIDLTASQIAAADDDEAFRFIKGMVHPAGARKSNGSTFTGSPLAGGTVETAFQEWYGVPYFAATFWHLEACSPVSSAHDSHCVNAPDGSGTLKRYEVKPGSAPFPAPHTTYAAQLQNFANWWQYHRKRRLMTAAALGRMINGLGEGLRIGTAYLNASPPGSTNRPAISLTSTTGAAGDKTRAAVTGTFYNHAHIAGAVTPTRAALEHVRQQFDTNPSIIQHACQRNYAFIVTDGYATDAGVDLNGNPQPALATVAEAAYNSPLRASGPNALPLGKVPPGDPGRPNPDLNTNLHLNIYAVSLGLKGLKWPALDANGDNLPDSPTSFPVHPDRREKVDDLWNATIKGRGHMLIAQNGEDLSAAVGRVLFDITSVQGTQGTASFSSVVLGSNAFVLLSNYNAGRWNGDVVRRAVDPATGAIGTTDVWSAAQQLDAIADPAARVLFTRDGPFDLSTVGSTVNPSGPAAVTAAKVDYLRGARANEGFGTNQFRPRLSRFGAVVSSEPAMNDARDTVFVAANDGFLHAIDTATGDERWAYAPKDALAPLGQSTQLNWGHRALHDGSPAVARIGSTEMLFGSLGTGGRSWYALDVSSATATLTAAQRANTVKWELPGADATLASQMGLAVAKPIVIKRSSGAQQVLLTSGYNAPIADGRGRLFVRDAVTGAEIATIATPVVQAGIDPGLGQVNAYREVDGTVRYVYGGDERGNLWRFDLDTHSVLKVTTLTDASGNAQAITAKPALVQYKGMRIVLVSTGRLLGVSDMAPETRGNGFYAIRDDDTTLLNPRATLVKQDVSVDANGARRISNPQSVNFATRRGWFIDLPADERANIEPKVGLKTVALVTNQPQGDPCSMKSYQYELEITTGAAPSGAAYADGLIGTALSTNQGVSGSGIIVTGTPGSGSGGGSGNGGSGSGVTVSKPMHCSTGVDGALICVPLQNADLLDPRKSGWRRVVK